MLTALVGNPLQADLRVFDNLVNDVTQALASGQPIADVVSNFADKFQTMFDKASSLIEQHPEAVALTGFAAIAKLGLELSWSGVQGGAGSQLAKTFMGELYRATGSESLMQMMLNGPP